MKMQFRFSGKNIIYNLSYFYNRADGQVDTPEVERQSGGFLSLKSKQGLVCLNLISP